MNREERLEFCTICKNRKMDFEKGLLCGITNDYAKFETLCDDYDEDLEKRAHKFIRDLNACGHQNASKSLDPISNKENGALLFILGVLALLFSIKFLAGLGILIIPFSAIIYGARTYLKGLEQEKLIKRNDAFDNNKT